MNEYTVEVSKRAKADLKLLYLYITNEILEPQIAITLLRKIRAQLLSLKQMPYRYGLIQEESFRTNQIRKFPVENYFVFYTVDSVQKTVYIIRILYNRRSWQDIVLRL